MKTFQRGQVGETYRNSSFLTLCKNGVRFGCIRVLSFELFSSCYSLYSSFDSECNVMYLS
jgi:hypothetical protein